MDYPEPRSLQSRGTELSTAVLHFHEATARRLGLSAAEHKALALIVRAGPLPTGALAPELGVGVTAVTGIVDRLERAGYVRREPDPADRRRVLLVADESRAPDLGGILADLGRELDAVLAKYDEREKAAIVDYVEHTIGVLRAQTAKLAR